MSQGSRQGRWQTFYSEAPVHFKLLFPCECTPPFHQTRFKCSNGTPNRYSHISRQDARLNQWFASLPETVKQCPNSGANSYLSITYILTRSHSLCLQRHKNCETIRDIPLELHIRTLQSTGTLYAARGAP
jgi:hypothetical protein